MDWHLKNNLSIVVTALIILSSFSVITFSFEKANGILPTAAATGMSQNAQSTSLIFFKDNYSSIVGWTQIGTSVTVNALSFPGVVNFNHAVDGGGHVDNRVFKQLPAKLVAGYWIANFKYEFTASNIPAAYPFALTSSHANPEQQGAGSAILVYHGDDSNVLHIRTWNGTMNVDSPGLYTGIPISPNTPYFVKLERTPTHLVLSVFSDSARTIQVPGSPITASIEANNFHNLNFIQHSTSTSSGHARTLTAQVDNTVIFVK